MIPVSVPVVVSKARSSVGMNGPTHRSAALAIDFAPVSTTSWRRTERTSAPARVASGPGGRHAPTLGPAARLALPPAPVLGEVMSDQPEQRPIEMSAGLPSTVLPEQPPALRAALEQALAADDPRAAVAAVVAANPRFLEGWATLGDLGRDVIERYAAYRVGYHRGLDTRAAVGADPATCAGTLPATAGFCARCAGSA